MKNEFDNQLSISDDLNEIIVNEPIIVHPNEQETV